MYPTKPLGEILEIIRNGKSCKQTSDKNGNKITRIETISFGEINEDKVGYFDLTSDEKIKYQIDKGDILFSHINSVEHIGKIAIAKKDYSDLFHGMNLLLLRGNKKDILDNYLYVILQFYFKSGYWSKICNKAINQASLNQKNIIDIQIPLPPLPTQKLIVQKLDSSFEKINKSIELTKKNLENIEELNKSVLESFGDFKKVLVGDIVEELFAGGDLPKDGRYSKEKTDEYNIQIFANAIKEDGLYGYTEKPRVIKSAITISARGTIGFTKLRLEPFYPIVRLLVLIPKKELADLKYLEYILNTINLKQFGSSIPQLSVPQLKSFEIPLPPLQKQKEIVSYLDKVFLKNKALKETYQKKLKDLEEMKQSLLKEAFEGRLIP